MRHFLFAKIEPARLKANQNLGWFKTVLLLTHYKMSEMLSYIALLSFFFDAQKQPLTWLYLRLMLQKSSKLLIPIFPTQSALFISSPAVFSHSLFICTANEMLANAGLVNSVHKGQVQGVTRS